MTVGVLSSLTPFLYPSKQIYVVVKDNATKLKHTIAVKT